MYLVLIALYIDSTGISFYCSQYMNSKNVGTYFENKNSLKQAYIRFIKTPAVIGNLYKMKLPIDIFLLLLVLYLLPTIVLPRYNYTKTEI